jgi:hypothetical protein
MKPLLIIFASLTWAWLAVDPTYSQIYDGTWWWPAGNMLVSSGLILIGITMLYSGQKS